MALSKNSFERYAEATVNTFIAAANWSVSIKIDD
jgi:hypothetical protein